MVTSISANKEWSVHSVRTDEEGRQWHGFSIAYDLTQIVHKPTRFPGTTGHQVNLLDLLLISCPEVCSDEVLSPLGISDHSLINTRWCQTEIIPWCMSSQEDLSVSQILHDGYFFFFTDFFKNRAARTDTLFSELFLSDMGKFISMWIHQQGPNSQPLFTPGIAAAITQRKHSYHFYHRERCAGIISAFRTLCRNCKCLLKNAKSSYSS